MPAQSPQLKRVFHDLADPIRISVLDRLSDGPASASELARPFEMALPSFTHHLEAPQLRGLAPVPARRFTGRAQRFTTGPAQTGSGLTAL